MMQRNIESSIAITLQNAIKRRIKHNRTFCSYSFLPFSAGRNGAVLKFERKPKVLSKTSSTQHSKNNDENLQNVSGQWRDLNRKVMYKKHVKQGDLQRFRKTSINGKILRRRKDENHSGINEGKNKMEEYLNDFFYFKDQIEFKVNQFENIPSKIKSMSISKNQTIYDARGKSRVKLNNLRRVSKKNFSCTDYPNLFTSYSPPNHKGQNYNKFYILNLASSKIVQQAIESVNFHQIPVKQYCYAMNNCSNTIEDNIFLLAFNKIEENDCRSQHSQHRESFFWVNRPLKHSQRSIVFRNIIEFLQKCVISMQYMLQIPQKVLVLDANGCVSYINRQEIEQKCQKLSRPLKIEQKRESKTIAQVCLSMYLLSMTRGSYKIEGA